MSTSRVANAFNDAVPNFQPAIKVSVFFNKIESITYETFFEHWQGVHADLAVATQAFRGHILRYVQVKPSETRRSEGSLTYLDSTTKHRK